MHAKRSPIRAYGILLFFIFAIEILLIMAFDGLLPTATPSWLVATADAALITMATSILVWRLFVRPFNEALLGEAARSRAITEAAAESIVTIDSRGLIESFNPSAERMFGHNAADVIGKNVKLLMPEPDAGAHDGYLERHLRTGKSHIIGRPREVVALHRNGTLFPVELNVAEIKLGNERRFTGVMRDITERKINEAQIQHLAHFDSLTDLPNRTLFNDRLHQSISMAKREKRKLALCYLDLDGFKAVNDTLGHDRGDELLKLTASRLKHAVRESDTVARLGGDEFAVILPQITGRGDAALVAEKIIDMLAAPFHLQGSDQSAHIGVSIGIAVFPADAGEAEQLVKMADIAMYNAKKAGNRFQFTAGSHAHGEIP
ncbi:MAG: diguanylate cyclase domain-containing protein [Burkholderiales bacterium]